MNCAWSEHNRIIWEQVEIIHIEQQSNKKNLQKKIIYGSESQQPSQYADRESICTVLHLNRTNQ